MLTTILIVTCVVVLLVVLIFVIGALLPREHHAEAERLLPAEPQQIWDLITDPAKAPQWRSDLAQAQQISTSTVRETDRHGKSMTFETVRSEPLRLLVRRIADPDLPFGGQWTMTIEPASGGSRLRIVEDGFVKPALFRFMSRFVFGHDRTINKFLDDLQRHLAKQRSAEARQ